MAYINSYPEPYRSAALDSIVDRWLMYNRECTSYCAWMLEHLNGVIINKTIPKKGSWNANLWDDRARELGLTVNKSPEVGCIAQWEGNHVAYVVEVSGDSVHILEYNYIKAAWSERDVKISAVSNFIHFGGEDKARAALGVSSSNGSSISGAVAQKGTFRASQTMKIRYTPSVSQASTNEWKANSSPTIAKNETRNYDQYIDNDGYRWISYVGTTTGKRCYIARRTLDGKTIFGEAY